MLRLHQSLARTCERDLVLLLYILVLLGSTFANITFPHLRTSGFSPTFVKSDAFLSRCPHDLISLFVHSVSNLSDEWTSLSVVDRCSCSGTSNFLFFLMFTIKDILFCTISYAILSCILCVLPMMFTFINFIFYPFRRTFRVTFWMGNTGMSYFFCTQYKKKSSYHFLTKPVSFFLG